MSSNRRFIITHEHKSGPAWIKRDIFHSIAEEDQVVLADDIRYAGEHITHRDRLFILCQESHRLVPTGLAVIKEGVGDLELEPQVLVPHTCLCDMQTFCPTPE